MKISYNWLNTYLQLDFSPDKIASYLTDIGLEVESIDVFESIKGGLKGVLIGEVIAKKPHPNADRLSLTNIDIGLSENLKIVCGAPNVEVGQKVAVATIGAVLYDDKDTFKIKKSKIRGEVSMGMICSEKELNLGNDANGIMILDSSINNGTPASEYFDVYSDVIFDIGLTPNRSDAMSHIGVARDLMTFLNYKGFHHKLCIPSINSFDNIVSNNKSKMEVLVEDYKSCPRYSGLCIRGVKVAESPNWLKDKIKSIGIIPTNNIVDVTNYVLHELGQPLHAFDLSKIRGNKIYVTNSTDKMSFVCLDGKKINMSSEDLMICDTEKPLCIAGVFGGVVSSVTEKTTDIFLESAYFNSTKIRKTAKRHNLSTDASFRYERGCDPNITMYALKRAAMLIVDISGGVIDSLIDLYPDEILPTKVNLLYQNMDKLVGEIIDRDIVKSILENLDIKIQNEDKEGLLLHVPTYRVDVKREVDVIEEVLRIYGFNKVVNPNKLNSIIPNNSVKSVDYCNVISNFLSSNGFNEVFNNSLINNSFHKLIEDIDLERNINILNPLSKELDVMRQSLLFGGLLNIAYNQNRGSKDLKFYEFGKTYHNELDSYIENKHLQLLVTGNIKRESWNNIKNNIDFYFIKEKVEHILYRLGIKNFKNSEGSGYGTSYSLTYSYKQQRLVSVGKVSKDLCIKFGVKSDVYMADFNWDFILQNKVEENKYVVLNKFPEIRRDLSILVDNNIKFSQLRDIIKKSNIKLLKHVDLFDVYEGEELQDGKKSYALSFIFSDKSRTLKDIEIDKLMKDLMNSFSKSINADFRG